jgi:hypothetical protein
MSDEKLGLWKKGDIDAAVDARYCGSAYYQHLPKAAHFVHSVARILHKRKAKDVAALCSAPSFFVMGSAPEGVTVKREPAFSYGGVDVSGRVWFGAEALNSSNGVQLPDTTDADTLFTFVSQTLNSGNAPTAYFHGAVGDQTLRYYPKGLDHPDECEDISFEGAHINQTTIKGALDKIHDRSLQTSTASQLALTLWEDRAKGHPVERAEGAVQGIVEVGLAQAMGNVRVKREETGAMGRFDLALIEHDPLDSSKTINHAILELKIVKSFTHSGTPVPPRDNKSAVLKGTKQAWAYREEHKSRMAALCCYDMRSTPSPNNCSELGSNVATKLNVEFWAWPLFPTPDAARDWYAEKELAGKT